jgi:hypothetical protein
MLQLTHKEDKGRLLVAFALIAFVFADAGGQSIRFHYSG